MKDLMKYKDYFGSVHYDDDERVFHGKVEFIRALVSYEGTDVASLRKAFEEAVDDYLELCHKRKQVPEKPFKGSFNVRIGPRLHQEVALTALNEGMSLNQYIAWVLEKDNRERQETSRYATVVISGQKKAYRTGATVKISTGKSEEKKSASFSRGAAKAARTGKTRGGERASH
jgi:predicted HicB family RNase H-like nuclease